MKIAVAGVGYVGLSLSVLLGQKNEVYAYDINEEKVDLINNGISPIKDEYIKKYLSESNLKATSNYKEAFEDAKFIIISTPTNYDELSGVFDTSSVENVIEKINCDATIIIKSTVPIGYTEMMRKKYGKDIIFSPEFLREGYALYDNLYPSRIIVGNESKYSEDFSSILKECCLKPDVEIKYMSSTEAEAVKLFSNTYLAMRVAFFNELDTYSEINGLNTKNIIDGVCLDPRIGNYYNNPSFGYGGYCLPKDSKQLLANYDSIPQSLISGIVESNVKRKKYISSKLLEGNPNVIGIYRLLMKKGSDNFRSSAIYDIIGELKRMGKKVIIYEPSLFCDRYDGCSVVNDLALFDSLSDIVAVNRVDEDVKKLTKTIYTRDIFNKD